MAARRFEAKEPTIYRDLQNTMKRLGATSLRVPRDLLNSKDLAAEIIFDRGGRRYVVRCKKWGDWLDNFRAAERTIYYLFLALKEYGAEASGSFGKPAAEAAFDRAFEQLFAGFEATPEDTALLLGTGKQAWWEVLGVQASATKPEIVNAYRALARVHHPDAGGDAETFKRLRRAYEEGLEGKR